MSAADDLADWWQHTCSVQRFAGTGAYGDTYDAAVDLTGFLDDRRRLVRDADGAEVVSETTFLLPAATAEVPLGSLVTLPALFGGRTATVLATSRHDAGTQDTPNHLELALT